MLLNAAIVTTALGISAVLFHKRIRKNETWQATVTPLASIIGSGFLVVVPLLGHLMGVYAPIGMATVLILAYLVGSAIRFNIVHAEALTYNSESSLLKQLERLSSMLLAIAYFVSVAFYLKLLSSFLLEPMGLKQGYNEQILTTMILLFISVTGWIRGLKMLEVLEKYSVSVKLAIIGSLLTGWAYFDFELLRNGYEIKAGKGAGEFWDTLRIIAGSLLVVQGFETSRYLGNHYSPEKRVFSMKSAQLISSVIYLAFIIVCIPSFRTLSGEIKETEIIRLSGDVASVLPFLLIVAAVMSQFSASVADTIGAGELINYHVKGRLSLPSGFTYLIVGAVGIFLVWTTNIFEVISIASRCFALYYLSQVLISNLVNLRVSEGRKKILLSVYFSIVSLILIFVVLFAKPIES
ncbi:MAG: hypothetical protein H6618_05830 [Deltaproteobacteria bacterium]|nr:hypothetical protein [Deltaproteobacteria bacterium]